MNCNVKKTRQKIVWTKFGGCSLTRTTLIWYLFPHIFFLIWPVETWFGGKKYRQTYGKLNCLNECFVEKLHPSNLVNPKKTNSDYRRKFSNLGNWKEQDWKKRASTGFEPVTSAIPARCSANWVHIFYLHPQFKYELFHIHFTSFHCTGRYELNKLTSLAMCVFIAQLVKHRK